MSMHKPNRLLVSVFIIVLVMAIVIVFSKSTNQKSTEEKPIALLSQPVKNKASVDSAAESLNTLTAQMSQTQKTISDVAKDNQLLKKENETLKSALNSKTTQETADLHAQLDALKNQIQGISATKTTNASYPIQDDNHLQAIHQVVELNPYDAKQMNLMAMQKQKQIEENKNKKIKPLAAFTIPANATSVKDRLMTALVGRIPVKGVVTDPYPFKIVISDDNLAANGLRIPHLLQMIVSGYCEGDLNLSSVRGWVTSLTFVFEDGRISTTSSNDNNIGAFTKSNSLGYLSDDQGNPFIRGQLITNAPAYLAENFGMGMSRGFAKAFAQSQTTNSTNIFGGTQSSVTGSPFKYAAYNAVSDGTNDVAEWLHDREQQSFDAIYVSPVDDSGNYRGIAVNFAKEIHIDYDPQGRKLDYETPNQIRLLD